MLCLDEYLWFQDVDMLASKLPNVVANNRIKDECFNHVTFLFPSKKSCIPVREKLYQDCIEAMMKLEKV